MWEYRYLVKILISFPSNIYSGVRLLDHRVLLFSGSVVSVSLWPMDCSTPGFPVHHHLPELDLTHVHRVGDAIQPSYLLLCPSLALNLPQHQGLFQWIVLSHQVAKVLEFQLQHQSFQWIFSTDYKCSAYQLTQNWAKFGKIFTVSLTGEYGLLKSCASSIFLLHGNIHPQKVVITVVDQISEEKKRR